MLNVNYDPNEVCPKFDKAISETFRDAKNKEDGSDTEEMVRHFQEIMGYLIQPLRDLAVWFLFIGPGKNGKTKKMQTIEELVNKNAIFADRIGDVEKDRFKIGSLAGKLILLDDDIDHDTKLPDGFLKSISERKLLSGQLKYKDSFEFIACCAPVLLANNYPVTSDISKGIRRRACIVPFDRTFGKDDSDNKLYPYIWENEMSGVLNRAIEGLERIRKRGGFDVPDACRGAYYQWLIQANPLVSFISEECIHQSNVSTLIKDFTCKTEI